jgi:hypothetical protein
VLLPLTLMLFAQSVSTVLAPDPPPGPMQAENIYLRPGHAYSDDRMFPDIAIGALSVDGDTLYVQLTNKGRSRTEVPIQIAARANAGSVKSQLAEARTGPLKAGESRWVAIHGFSVRTAATTPVVFALANATAVSAVARMLPPPGSSLDRSGQQCGDCTQDADQTNNSVIVTADALKHGKPE